VFADRRPHYVPALSLADTEALLHLSNLKVPF
jgi:hypothetical protein